jgi:hypothetical protein
VLWDLVVEYWRYELFFYRKVVKSECGRLFLRGRGHARFDLLLAEFGRTS